MEDEGEVFTDGFSTASAIEAIPLSLSITQSRAGQQCSWPTLVLRLRAGSNAAWTGLISWSSLL